MNFSVNFAQRYYLTLCAFIALMAFRYFIIVDLETLLAEHSMWRFKHLNTNRDITVDMYVQYVYICLFVNLWAFIA